MYFKREEKYLVTEKKNPNFVFNLTAGKNVGLYKATPLNSKTKQTFQEAHQDQGIYHIYVMNITGLRLTHKKDTSHPLIQHQNQNSSHVYG